MTNKIVVDCSFNALIRCNPAVVNALVHDDLTSQKLLVEFK